MTADDAADSAQLSAETIQKLTDHANELAWKLPDLNVLRPELEGQYPPIAETLQEHISRSDERNRLILPDLRAFGNDAVAVFTDYGGESKDAKYLTYSTLVCGWKLTGSFHEMMKIVRAQPHGLGTKEIAYKDFHMGQIQRSLDKYLAALDTVPGFLFTLAVDKRLTSLFGPKGNDTRALISFALEEAHIGDRGPQVNEKLLRVVHIAAFLTGLLAHDGQNIFWMTDNDAISPTPEMHEKSLFLFQRLLGIYTRPTYRFPLLGGALPFEERHLETLDLLSSTDIVAGALDRYLTQCDSVSADDIMVKEGCDRVLQWLAHDGIGLKKMNVIMRPGSDGTIEATTLEFGLTHPPEDATIIPLAL